MILVQAWAVRRLISTYNYLCRRPHVPREREIRRMMISQGIAIDLDPSPAASERGDAAEADAWEAFAEEGEEEEEQELDEECELSEEETSGEAIRSNTCRA